MVLMTPRSTVTNKGVHVDATTFNDLIEDPDTVLVDMRNHYESEIGHFKNAVTPDVDTFRDSLDIIEQDLQDSQRRQKTSDVLHRRNSL